LEPARLGDVVRDAFLAAFDDAADPGQRQLRHQHVEQDEGDHQPDELRGKGLRLERRKAAVVLALGDLDLGLVLGHRRRRPYSANSSKSAISSEKMPSASVMAKPKIRLPNWPCAADGLRKAAAR